MTFHTRRLPHYHPIGHPIFLTWHLHGSLPTGRYFPPGTTSGQAFVAMDRLLDNARTGPLHLTDPKIAQITLDTIHYHESALGHYRLHKFVVMRNHVHLLITPSLEVSKVMQSLKRFTARESNRILGVSGQPFWQEASYDRVVRDQTEFLRIARYIEMNPVKAGLVDWPEEFCWSSAWMVNKR